MLFIMDACQWEHLYEGLYVCVSCPVYINCHTSYVIYYGCVSVRAFVWKFVCLVLFILLYVLFYFIMGVCQWESLYESLCVLYCIYCRTSYVISLYVCLSESMCMKVYMIVCLVLYILSYLLCYFIIGVGKWEHVYESLYDCVSCPVYIDVRLVLFHYRCVSVRACLW